jgi:hypothetical protein
MPSENEKKRGEPSRETKQYREWKGMNQTDARTAIDDTEWWWLENAMTVGKGKVRILPHQGPAVYTAPFLIVGLYGVMLLNIPYLICILSDGSMVQVTLGGMPTQIAPAGTVTAAADVSVWQGTRILILDPVHGYMTWDGATFTVLDASKLGTTIAVFSGRVWLANARTITFTDAGSYTSFAGSGGSFPITDEAFPGNITRLLSAMEQLWIIGQGAVNALSNVQVVGGIATFSNTNIVSGVGTPNRLSVIAFFRALAFLSKAGVYGLVGVTPQKLSDKLDGLFPGLTLTPDTPAALMTLNELPVLCLLVTYNDPATSPSTPRPVVMCYSQGKWFMASQGALTLIADVVVSGAWQAWGTDGKTLFALFGDAATPVAYTIRSKLYDFGSMVTMKQMYRIMLEFSATGIINPQVTIETEKGSQVANLSLANYSFWVNNAGQVVPWTTA